MYLCIHDNRHLSLFLSATGQFQLRTRFSKNIISSSGNYVANTKMLISCAVTELLTCAHSKNSFSNDSAHLIENINTI